MSTAMTPARRGDVGSSWPARGVRLVKDYLALTKPRVIELLLVATIPVMLLAQRGSVDVPLILTTLFGGWLGAASANTLNCVVDADIDKLMDRTKNRPLVRGAMSRRAALFFGLGLGVASFGWLWRTTNLLAASLVVATIAFYVFVYSMWLKRRTSQNVVWGGAAGCMPALVGWAAATGTLAWPALVVFMVIFFWTPPHTWSLAMKYLKDYSAAKVPMLPTVADSRIVTRRIIWYTWATVLTTLVLIPATGLLYAGVAVLAGAWFLYEAYRLSAGLAAGRPVEPFRLFLLSNNYLAAVFVGLAVDSALGWPTVANLLS